MPAVEIKPDVYWVGVNDRTTDLFEGLWPVTDAGVSYNTFIIKDEKKVVIDLVKAFKTDAFFDQVHSVIPLKEIDYLILNHMEPDHTGVIKTLHQIAPDIRIVGSQKMKEMLAAYYGITEPVQVVQDGDVLDIGKRKLVFYETPYVHWPETIVTYDPSEKILFPCDAFGSYGALRGSIFDDECKDKQFYIQEALRYYVNIVAKFSNPVLKAIDKLSALDIEIIAPSHGLIWRSEPKTIIDLYRNWALLAKGGGEPGVTMLYGSMYGNTESVMNAIAQGLSCKGIPIDIFDVARTHVSYMLPSLWTKSGVVIGAPTYEGDCFPPMMQVLEMAALKRIQNKSALYFGSYGWSGGALKKIKSVIEPLNWKLQETLEFKGGIQDALLEKAKQLGRKFAENLLS